MATASADLQPLAAAYFDTPGEHLAKARTALRAGQGRQAAPMQLRHTLRNGQAQASDAAAAAAEAKVPR